MVNTALRDARLRAHMSQGDLARRIREAGFRCGDRNSCTREMVQRWESGKVRRPQGRYLLALENVLGQPAETLGFDADVRYGMDRARAIAEAGLDTLLPLPEPASSYGPLTGIWLSAYDYYSSGRDQTLTSRHHVLVLQRGARLMVRSLPASASQLSMDLSVNGQVITGTWTEQTQPDGYYRGAVYHGAIQLLAEPTGHRMAGTWVGFGRELEVNTGPWTLTLVDEHVDAGTVERWNRTPDTDPAPR
jgi:transcriptional regulator with XRE-family HTH domain